MSAVGAIAFRHVRTNRQPDGLPQHVSVIPAMHHLRIARGPDPCIKDDRPSCHGLTGRLALPAIAVCREGLANLTGGQADGARRRRRSRRLLGTGTAIAVLRQRRLLSGRSGWRSGRGRGRWW
jgi:hypothetical protein